MTRVSILTISAAAVGLALSVAAGNTVYAQTPGAAAMSSPTAAEGTPAGEGVSKEAVHRFMAQFDIPVEESGTPVAAAPVDSAPPTARLADLQRIAVDSNVTWRKVYHVSWAASDLPVTTSTDAESMVDQSGIVTIKTSWIPANSAMNSVAAADNATIQFEGDAPTKEISLDLDNVSIPHAIAAIAERTHTHWQPVYVLAPIAGVTPTANRVAIAAPPRMTFQTYEETQLFNGPFTIHVSPDNVNPTPAQIDAANQAAAAAQAAATAAQAAATNGAAPPATYYNPYTGAYTSAPIIDPYGGNTVINGGTPSVHTF